MFMPCTQTTLFEHYCIFFKVCNICFEPFEQFWDETLEEWRYNDAIRIDELVMLSQNIYFISII